MKHHPKLKPGLVATIRKRYNSRLERLKKYDRTGWLFEEFREECVVKRFVPRNGKKRIVLKIAFKPQPLLIPVQRPKTSGEVYGVWDRENIRPLPQYQRVRHYRKTI
jgi:hypothetical protein